MAPQERLALQSIIKECTWKAGCVSAPAGLGCVHVFNGFCGCTVRCARVRARVTGGRACDGRCAQCPSPCVYVCMCVCVHARVRLCAGFHACTRVVYCLVECVCLPVAMPVQPGVNQCLVQAGPVGWAARPPGGAPSVCERASQHHRVHGRVLRVLAPLTHRVHVLHTRTYMHMNTHSRAHPQQLAVVATRASKSAGWVRIHVLALAQSCCISGRKHTSVACAACAGPGGSVTNALTPGVWADTQPLSHSATQHLCFDPRGVGWYPATQPLVPCVKAQPLVPFVSKLIPQSMLLSDLTSMLDAGWACSANN